MARPQWRTPAKDYPKRMPENFWMLEQRRVKMHDLSRMPQCVATARSTGQRCRCVRVLGSDYCVKHGGSGHIKERIQRLGGPVVRAKSVPSLRHQNLKKRLEVETYLHDMASNAHVEHMPIQLRIELASLPLGARARKYMKWLEGRSV